jgi:peroxiredoxin
MLNRFKLAALSCIACLVVVAPSPAADKPADGSNKATAETKSASGVGTEVKGIVAAVREKMQAGKTSEADLADELKRFEALFAKHKGEKSEEMASAAILRAQLYTQVIKDDAKGKALLDQVAKDYPDTNAAKSVQAMQKSLEMAAKLAVGKTFSEFSVTGTDGKPLSTADYKGKVVLVDFWATWCGPCVAELPNVKAAYAKHHEHGFEIIGVSLDSDKDKLTEFQAKNGIAWRQYFDGKGWQNKLAQDYGIQSIPATFLLDGDGKIIGSNLRGEALEAAVAKALKKDAK